MKMFSHYASRRNDCILAAAFEVKKEIPGKIFWNKVLFSLDSQRTRRAQSA
jgi:hypothetical protein